jgi:hypothetical protein
VLICSVTTNLSWSQQETLTEAPLEVQQIVDAGSKYADKLIVVKGCYVITFEVSVLRPCEEKYDRRKYSVWVYDRGKIDIGKLGISLARPTPLVLKAEFKTGGRYGHLRFYRHSLLVHELLSHGEPRNP